MEKSIEKSEISNKIKEKITELNELRNNAIDMGLSVSINTGLFKDKSKNALFVYIYEDTKY
ncbi:MAG TPA: hypothetical protein PLE28_03630 [bacterium]|nr:hypothetical protein [bacterium]